MSDRFPPIEPFAQGLLPVGDGNAIHWEASGNPQGRPALYLHGGPGSGVTTGYRRYFDPTRYRIVSFEQRGCGRSLPLVTVETLATNTTPHLLADIEALRAHLGVKDWLVFGVSWGTTLALAYAQAFPDRVSALVLAAVTTTSRAEVAWITEAMGRVFPEAWEKLVEEAGVAPGQRVIDACYARITHPDVVVRERMARAWCAWEDTHVSLNPGFAPYPKFQDPGFAQVFATLVLHYWKHAAFLDDGQLLAGMRALAHVPGYLIHGRNDISGPLVTAWELHKAWPGSKLVVVEEDGHGGKGMTAAILDAVRLLA